MLLSLCVCVCVHAWVHTCAETACVCGGWRSVLGIFLMALQFVLMFFTYLCVYMTRSTLGSSGPHRGQKSVTTLGAGITGCEPFVGTGN